MAGYHGKQAVGEGIYLNLASWRFEYIGREGGILPEDEETHYVKLPLPAAAVLGSLTGLAYIIFMPLVFCITFIYTLCRWLERTIKTTKEELPVGLKKTMTSK